MKLTNLLQILTGLSRLTSLFSKLQTTHYYMYTKKHLPNQLPGEKVVKILRRHWFIPLKTILFYILLGCIPIVFIYLISKTTPGLLESYIGYPLLVLGISTYYLFNILFFFQGLIDYYLDVWIITNQRIINIEQKGLFARIISEQRLSRIQDVTSEVKGILNTLFGYGNVFVQTAGEEKRFNFWEIPDAHEIARIIHEVADKYKHGHPDQD